jgi:hypothetical protein
VDGGEVQPSLHNCDEDICGGTDNDMHYSGTNNDMHYNLERGIIKRKPAISDMH